MNLLDELPVDASQAGLVLFVLAVLFLYSPALVRPPDATLVVLEVAILFLAYMLILVGLNLQFGHTGLVNFGPVAFFAVGGYAAAIFTAADPYRGIGLGYPWPVGLVAAIVAAIALGAVIGYSTLRLRDDFLAIVTLAVAEIVHGVVITFGNITGGAIGLQTVPRPITGLTETGGPGLFATVFVMGGLALLVYGVFHRLSSAPYGRVLRAIRADQLVTETLGKQVFHYKIAVFVYGAALAGLAGAAYVFYVGAASPSFFTIDVTVTVWVGMLIGGAGNDHGVIGGLAILMSFRLLTRFLNERIPFVTQDQFAAVRLILVGLLLMAIIKYRPQGLWGNPEELEVES